MCLFFSSSASFLARHLLSVIIIIISPNRTPTTYLPTLFEPGSSFIQIPPSFGFPPHRHPFRPPSSNLQYDTIQYGLGAHNYLFLSLGPCTTSKQHYYCLAHDSLTARSLYSGSPHNEHNKKSPTPTRFACRRADHTLFLPYLSADNTSREYGPALGALGFLFGIFFSSSCGSLLHNGVVRTTLGTAYCSGVSGAVQETPSNRVSRPPIAPRPLSVPYHPSPEFGPSPYCVVSQPRSHTRLPLKADP